MDTIRNKSKAHTQYRLSNGKRVPSVTTILGMIAKPELYRWHNKMGLDGIDTNKYVDIAARAGTCCHAMIEAYMSGKTFDPSDFTKDEQDMADNGMIKFLDWEAHHIIQPIANELVLVSEKNGYGGTIDCYCVLDGKKTLLDFKTSKTIYDSHLYQLSAYKELLLENGYEVDDCRILRIGRDEYEGFEDRAMGDSTLYYKMFEYAKGLYDTKKQIDKL